MAVGSKPENRTDEDWQAISDAHNLAQSQVILADSARVKRARAWAKELVKEENAEADAMNKIASGSDD